MTTKPRTLSDFRAAHDKNFIVPQKIQAALDALAKIGPEHYEYEADFLKLAALSTTDLAKFRDQFADYIVEVAMPLQSRSSNVKRIYCGSKKLAAKYREMP